jgi:dihydroneopterin aldolase
MDTLSLKGLQFYGRHGTESWERENGRRYIVDLELSLDLTRASQTDHLRDALDYRVVYARAHRVVESESHHLIETVAGRLVDEMFRAFPTVEAARVRVAKPDAPIGGLNQAVVVELARTREQWAAQSDALGVAEKSRSRA